MLNGIWVVNSPPDFTSVKIKSIIKFRHSYIDFCCFFTFDALGVIVYGSDQEVKELMRAVRKRNETGSFAWIGSDGWSARTLVSDGNEREVEGTLSVQPKANPVKGFDKYFLNLNVRNNTRNPWFIGK